MNKIINKYKEIDYVATVSRIIYLSVSGGCFITVLMTLIITTFRGIETGVYKTTIYTNALNEHYPELIILFAGAIAAILYILKLYREHMTEVKNYGK